jgi:hypothetical protein
MSHPATGTPAVPPGQAQNARKKDVDAPPATVKELAEQTAKSSKNGLSNAANAVGEAARQTGDAVGQAAKKSWYCVSSLFKDC